MERAEQLRVVKEILHHLDAATNVDAHDLRVFGLTRARGCEQ